MLKNLAKVQKIVNETIKKINKGIKNGRWYGRFQLGELNHEVVKLSETHFLIKYFFEFYDKETKTRKFYPYHFEIYFENENIKKKVDIKAFEKQLHEEIQRFIMHDTDAWSNGKKTLVQDYRRI